MTRARERLAVVMSIVAVLWILFMLWVEWNRTAPPVWSDPPPAIEREQPALPHPAGPWPRARPPPIVRSANGGFCITKFPNQQFKHDRCNSHADRRRSGADVTA